MHVGLDRPERAVERLTDPADGGRARAILELWTGVDFVDDPPDAAGDDVDLERARAWWGSRRADWQPGALYRGGRYHDGAPILAALARAAS